jgi:epsilon-lactone hydrolase
MAPPEESSDILANHFRTISSLRPDPPNPFLQRALYDTISHLSTEVSSVTYEDVTIPGQGGASTPAKWIRPTNASPNHVLLFMHGGGYSFGSLASHRKMCAQ